VRATHAGAGIRLFAFRDGHRFYSLSLWERAGVRVP
jgi:hypothetical protein